MDEKNKQQNPDDSNADQASTDTQQGADEKAGKQSPDQPTPGRKSYDDNPDHQQ